MSNDAPKVLLLLIRGDDHFYPPRGIWGASWKHGHGGGNCRERKQLSKNPRGGRLKGWGCSRMGDEVGRVAEDQTIEGFK